MKTGNNIATNNYVIRLWSAFHKPNKCDPHSNARNLFHGTVQSVITKKEWHFSTAAQFLTLMEKLYKDDEIYRTLE